MPPLCTFRHGLESLVPEIRVIAVYWGYTGIMENKMETTIQGVGFRV